jgi:pyruvate dehydrogenase E2 component (dihydrolipoamide acetyltransferase)
MSGPTAKGEVTVEELDRTQQTLARRAAEARAIVPEGVLRAQATVSEPPGAARVVAAAARALREHPRANASYRDARFELYSRINVAVAVSARDTISFPTIFDADTKETGAIAEELERLSARAASGELTAADVSGATFTVYVMTGAVTGYTPIISAPQAATLAVGVPRDGSAELTLVCDHRILYGEPAGTFLGRIAELLSD